MAEFGQCNRIALPFFLVKKGGIVCKRIAR